MRYKAPEHFVAIEEAKYIYKIGGPDLRNVVSQLPCSQNIKEDEIMLEPTELAYKLGISSGMKMNQILSELGLQAKTDKGWVCTDKAKTICARHSWSKGNKSGYNYKWKLSAIKEMINEKETI